MLAVAFMLFSYWIDVSAGRADWFHRSGAVAVFLSGVLAYRSLARHYKKFFNAEVRGHVLRTSRGQQWGDRLTLCTVNPGNRWVGHGGPTVTRLYVDIRT